MGFCKIMPKYYIRDSQEGRTRTNIELSVVSVKSAPYKKRESANISETDEFYPFEFFRKHCPQFLRTFGLEDEEIKPHEDKLPEEDNLDALNDEEYYEHMMSRFSGEEFMRYLRFKGLKGNANYVMGHGFFVPLSKDKDKQNYADPNAIHLPAEYLINAPG